MATKISDMTIQLNAHLDASFFKFRLALDDLGSDF